MQASGGWDFVYVSSLYTQIVRDRARRNLKPTY